LISNAPTPVAQCRARSLGHRLRRVDPDVGFQRGEFVAAAPAEYLGDRHAQHAARQVVQRDVDAGVGAMVTRHRTLQRGQQARKVQRIATLQHRCQPVGDHMIPCPITRGPSRNQCWAWRGRWRPWRRRAPITISYTFGIRRIDRHQLLGVADHLPPAQ
jgi:hypothetical protein